MLSPAICPESQTLPWRSTGQRLQTARPTGDVTGPAPGFEDITFGVEFQYFRTEYAALGARRIGGRPQLIRPRIGLPVQRPDVIVLVDINIDDLLHAPFVGEPLGPRGVDFIYRRDLRACRRQ